MPPMLRELHLSGLGVIDDATLELAPGLNVLTGETGAGKTMVTVGLTLALGQRARAHLVAEGRARASAQARFDVAGPAFDEWAEDGDLVLSRVIAADGRSTGRAGGQLAPLSTLAELGANLVEVHGQHQAQRLLSPATHLDLLDRFAGRDHLAAVGAYRRAFTDLRQARARLEELDERGREREREKDLLAYQVREIEGVGLSPGEIGALLAEEGRLANVERIREGLADARGLLDGGAADGLAAAARSIAEAADLDEEARPLAERIASLAEEARDAAGEVRDRLERAELDPARLEAVRERLAAIRQLERKYGEGEAAIFAFLGEARSRLAALEGAGAERDALVAEVRRRSEEVEASAAGLAGTRREAAGRLAAALEAEVHELGMAGARLVVAVRPLEAPGPDGSESVELLLGGGPGQEPRPLASAASGGELSRTMLACRTVLADLDEVPTLVFDEVDAGIGGKAGVAVGRRLARLARSRQVLVVTHLPQIACFADRHFRVTKDAGRTVVEELGEAERVEELSRMLSGMPTSEAAAHAGQLLAEAGREKAG